MFAELMRESERFKWYGDRATINGNVEQFYSYMEDCYDKAKVFLGFEQEGYLKIPIYIRPSSECPTGIGGGTAGVNCSTVLEHGGIISGVGVCCPMSW
jgi:hypothetical protein